MARKILGWLIVWAVLAGALRAVPLPKDDGEPARQALQKELRTLLADERFAELEARARHYVETKEQFKDGAWKLSSWLGTFAAPKDKKDAKQWTAHLETIDRWVAASSEEPSLAMTAKGAALTGFAWLARGGGYANTVTDEGWRLHASRLAEAEKVLESVPREKRLPIWYTAMQVVALGQGWDKQRYGELVKQAVNVEPEFLQVYFNMAYFLLPRWYGTEGEWQRFALAMADAHGAEYYARICWAQAHYEGYSELFKKHGVDWALVKKGFEELRKSRPESVWILHGYCRMACGAGDRKTAAEIFKILGWDYTESAWSSRADFDRDRRWALRLPKVPVW